MELDWMDKLIRTATGSLRNSVYRAAAAKELRGHLTALYEEGRGRGLDASGAEKWALEHIGPPAKLKEQYARAEAARDGSLQYYGRSVRHGALLCGAVWYFTALFIFGPMFAHFQTPMAVVFQTHPHLCLIYSVFIHCIPFAALTLFLRRRFQGQAHAQARVLGGLVFAWLVGTVIILLLYGLFHQIPPWQVGRLMEVIQRRRPRLPWFTPAFCVLTLLHCVILGLLPLPPCRSAPVPAE